jgi:hypothetical protein
MDQTTLQQKPLEKTVSIKMVTDAWFSYIERVNKLINSLTEEQITADTSPGRNSGLYLFGHLIAIHDDMIPILGFGERLYPQLDRAFVDNPDKLGLETPAVDTLKSYWNTINIKLADHIRNMPEDEWFSRHNKVAEADFAKEPHRNKLNILINRTNHMSYHLGQMVYLEGK